MVVGNEELVNGVDRTVVAAVVLSEGVKLVEE
jgi:hypothetical protein